MFWALFLCTFVALSSSVIIPSVPKNFVASDEVLSGIADEIADKFVKDFLEFHKTGHESQALREVSMQLARMHSKKDIFTKETSELAAADSFFLCTTCRATAKIAIQMVREENGELNGPDADEHAKVLMLEFCRRFDLQTEEVCLGLYKSNWPVIRFIAEQSDMDSRTFCSLFLQLNFCKTSKNPAYNFTVDIDRSGGTIKGPKNDIPQIGPNSVAVLHITDIHHDPLYEPGSLAECDEPLCCQRNKITAEGTNSAAGYWGDYRDCDAPWHMIESALDYITRTHQHIDFIYHTGDVVSHMVWKTSRESNIEVLSKVDDKFEEVFPGIPVYSCIGNHEPHPLNAFSPEDAPEEINTHWLYEHLYNSWSRWLPPSTKETILKGGYYTVLPKKGFRIIALNNNDCYNMNWWLFYNGQNKKTQLQWLHDTLLAAEEAKEYVHILTHVPTGGVFCWSVWSREFNRIVVRFSNTISGIFNGHTHKDEMAVHYSPKGHAIAVAWNGGSITTVGNKNPNYRFYNLDSSNMQVAESKTYIFNLTEANLKGKAEPPAWHEMYDFRTEFTTDLSPFGIDQLLEEFAANPNKLRQYWKYLSTNADPHLAWGCNRECLMNEICKIATTVSDQKNRCHELQEKLSKSLDDEDTTSSTSMPLPTESTTTPEDNKDDDGAVTITTIRFSSLVMLYVTLKYIF